MAEADSLLAVFLAAGKRNAEGEFRASVFSPDCQVDAQRGEKRDRYV